MGAATPGEWSVYVPDQGQDGYPDSLSIGCDTPTRSTYLASIPGGVHYPWAESNAGFIALAHNLMPALLDAVIELTKFIDYLDTASGDGAYEHEIQRALAILEKLK